MADQVNVTVNAGGGQTAPPKQSGCARYTKGCVLVVIALAVIGTIRAKMKEGKPLETGVPTKINDLKAEKKGTNGFSLKFHAAKGTDDVACDGDLVVSLRPWTGTGVGDEIAVVNAKVTQANFSRDAIGDPELSMDLAFQPRAEMPPLTAWLQADVTFTPVGGGPLKESTKFIHDAIGPPVAGGAPTTPTATTPGATPTTPVPEEDVSVLFDGMNLMQKYGKQAGKFRARYVGSPGSPNRKMTVINVDSIDKPGTGADHVGQIGVPSDQLDAILNSYFADPKYAHDALGVRPVLLLETEPRKGVATVVRVTEKK